MPGNPEHSDTRKAELPELVETGDGLSPWEMDVSDGIICCAAGDIRVSLVNAQILLVRVSWLRL